jgi:hypothetical protein
MALVRRELAAVAERHGVSDPSMSRETETEAET